MTGAQRCRTSPHTRGGLYQIKLGGRLDREWDDWFDGMTITADEAGDTLLTGEVVDQAALHGLLRKVRDCGLVLISLNRVDVADTLAGSAGA